MQGGYAEFFQHAKNEIQVKKEIYLNQKKYEIKTENQIKEIAFAFSDIEEIFANIIKKFEQFLADKKCYSNHMYSLFIKSYPGKHTNIESECIQLLENLQVEQEKEITIKIQLEKVLAQLKNNNPNSSDIQLLEKQIQTAEAHIKNYTERCNDYESHKKANGEILPDYLILRSQYHYKDANSKRSIEGIMTGYIKDFFLESLPDKTIGDFIKAYETFNSPASRVCKIAEYANKTDKIDSDEFATSLNIFFLSINIAIESMEKVAQHIEKIMAKLPPMSRLNMENYAVNLRNDLYTLQTRINKIITDTTSILAIKDQIEIPQRDMAI